ncbi:hypothetical protein [Polynucleobacter sp. UK-Mo-2m-Kol15]|uniref:hypothetical protein n=1 Tax=Polynucleobacter sp. UK-Mo-2m-Kol15 TaxID=2576916 RepID=UPI001C0D900C|nr:hypothetical protein [Polynucleobacter sp. UK-Mo-2m-Kol15]MBU3574782.1 hypothetical protein [Polynucleobacter sp. UK-Mo-2m-Kol15]
MRKKILIYEPLYKANQKIVDLAFCPLMINDNSLSEWRELKHLINIYDAYIHFNAEYTGLFSPKFQLKTHITGEEFIDFVNSNPGGDVYFINPFPQIKYWSYNVWMQGEIAHPGLKKAAKQLLEAAKIPIDIERTPRHGSNLLAYSNFWVGTPNFLEKYIVGILKPINQFLLENPNHPATIGVLAMTKHTVSAPLLPFIIERLFSTYLSLNPDIDAVCYPYSESEIIDKYCINDFERLLVRFMRNEVDRADIDCRFTDGLLGKMNLACQLFQQHHNDLYEYKIHPHLSR